MDPMSAGLALKDITRNTRMPLSDEKGQVKQNPVEDIIFLIM